MCFLNVSCNRLMFVDDFDQMNVCLCDLYRSHRLSYGADIFTTIPVNIYQEAETVPLKKF